LRIIVLTRAIELKLLTGRRSDLVEDRTRVVNRLRGTLLSMFPALERALDVTNTGPLRLLTGYQTPWREFGAMVATGITPVRALRAATSTAADLLQRPGLGRLAEGCTADIIAIPGDPFQDIDATGHVDFVMKDGTPHRLPD
jgi:hypothetical protein